LTKRRKERLQNDIERKDEVRRKKGKTTEVQLRDRRRTEQQGEQRRGEGRADLLNDRGGIERGGTD
jgi:hypothetical protein